MNQRLLDKDCVARIVTQRLLRKGEDFYGVNLSKNLTKYLMKYLPNPELRKAFLMIDLEDWCIPRSTCRWSSLSKGCVWCDLERIQSK